MGGEHNTLKLKQSSFKEAKPGEKWERLWGPTTNWGKKLLTGKTVQTSPLPEGRIKRAEWDPITLPSVEQHYSLKGDTQTWPPADAGSGSAELCMAPPVNNPSPALLEELLNWELQLSLWASSGQGDRVRCISASQHIKQPQSARTRGLLRMPECLPPWIWAQSQMRIDTQTGAQHVIRHVSKASGKPPFPLLVSERDRKIPSSSVRLSLPLSLAQTIPTRSLTPR